MTKLGFPIGNIIYSLIGIVSFYIISAIITIPFMLKRIFEYEGIMQEWYL